MRMKYFYIGVAAFAVAAVSIVLWAYKVSERRHQAYVDELRTAASVIEEKYRQQKVARAAASERVAPPAPETQSSPSPSEDIISAWEEFGKKKTAAAADPRWQEALALLVKGNRWQDLSAEQQDQVAAFLNNHQELLVELRRLAETGGPFLDLDLSKLVDMPHLAKLRDYGRLLSANIALTAARGDYETAVQDCVAILRIAEAVGREPVVISQMIRGVLDDILYECVSEHLHGDAVPRELLGAITAHAARVSGRDAIADALAIEAGWGLTQAFDEIRFRTGDYAYSPVMLVYGSIGLPLLDRDEELFVDIMQRMTEALRLPYYQAQPALEQIQSEVDNLSYINLISRPYLRTLVPAQARIPETQARCEARLGLMQVGLAVEQYHAEHGAYPATLDEVAPTLGGSIPHDPYTGEPFIYEPGPDGFTLYSNRGSVVEHNPARPGRGFDDRGNIVWRQ